VPVDVLTPGDLRSMRNRMAHGYFDINLDIVWGTVQHALPELEDQSLNAQREIEQQ